MNAQPVALIAFQEFDNLGVGYLTSVLSNAGYKSEVIDFQDGKEEILKILKRIKPFVVGFSVIFQYHINEFQELIKHLRNGGISCHFTAGGQYASLRYAELFSNIPSLDSIVRFEGEYTFLELVECLSEASDWKTCPGISYLDKKSIIVNPLRPVETDIDKFPFPVRSPLKEYALGKKFATILASRGCINNCSFCYLREYYQQASGPYKRIRKPGKVAGEMELLCKQMDCSVFLFQDDDFPVITRKGSEWVKLFCKELIRRELVGKIMWKINCRPDEIDYKSFALMRNHGLFLVFIGIEDGTNSGLKRLKKHMTVNECLEGINILKRLGIGFDYGFMLFQPTSTYGSLKDNLSFLREICGDGYSPVTFLKMMPFCATPIESELRREGRLKGKPGFLDYDFHEESLNHYYEFITDCFLTWLRDPDGLLNISKWARNYIAVCSSYFGSTTTLPLISMEIKQITSESNLFFLDTMKELATLFESGKYKNDKYLELKSYRETIKRKHEQYKKQINNTMETMLTLIELQQKSILVFT